MSKDLYEAVIAYLESVSVNALSSEEKDELCELIAKWCFDHVELYR